MKLDDIPEGPNQGIYLILSDSDTMSDRVEVVGWTTSSEDADWWYTRPGVRVVHAITKNTHTEDL